MTTHTTRNILSGQRAGGSRHKVKYYDERLLFVIRCFSNCFTLHRNALAGKATCLDPRLLFISQTRCIARLIVYPKELFTSSQYFTFTD